MNENIISDRMYEKIDRGEKIVVVDLFCGAGGMSTGAVNVVKQIADDVGKPPEEIAVLIAVNHWDRAVESHDANYPWAIQYNSKVQELRPRELYWDDETPIEEGDPIDLLIGCPDCTYFSTARGGGPKDPDSRATPREILDFVERLNVRNLLFENVPKFTDWGPLDDDGYPIKEKEGEYFDAWINQLTIEGFSVDWRVLNCANFGDATTRRRFFAIGRKDSGVSWPEQTHSQSGVDDTETWRTTADILDWSDPGESVFTRDLYGRPTPLAKKTMKRIAEGIRRNSGDIAPTFADAIETVTPETLKQLRDTVVPAEYAEIVANAVDQPFLVDYSDSDHINSPLPKAQPRRTTDWKPYVLGQQSGARARTVDEQPLNTITTDGAISYLDPRTIVLPRDGRNGGIHSNPAFDPSDRPLHTVIASDTRQGYVVTPYLVPFYTERKNQAPRTHSITSPTPTAVASKIPAGVAQAYLVAHQSAGTTQSVGLPAAPIDDKDKRALIIPELFPLGINVLFRQLKPRELARAQSFPEWYTFQGNKTETVEQIGNAVPVRTATALCEQLLLGHQPTIESFTNDSTAEEPADD